MTYDIYLSSFDVYTLASTKLLPLSMCSKIEKKRKHPMPNLPDGSGLGDHIQLLQIYECWDRNDYDIGWCKDNGLQVLLFFYEICNEGW